MHWAELCTGLAAGCPMAHCKAHSDGTGKKNARKEAAAERRDAGRQAAFHLLRPCGCQRTHAQAWRARTPPSRGPPFHPGNRGSAAARARVGRGRAGSLRDGTARTAAEVADLKGSSGFSRSSGDRFGPEGFVPRHGLTESKQGGAAPGGEGGRGARGWVAEGEARPETHPIRPDRT